MRDTVANITLPTVRDPLEVVRHQFEAWRKRRRCRCRIPEALWQAAAEQAMHWIGKMGGWQFSAAYIVFQSTQSYWFGLCIILAR